jgi:hypothetical protein
MAKGFVKKFSKGRVKVSELPTEAARQNDALLLKLGIGLGYLTDAEHSTYEVPEHVAHASPDDTIEGVYSVLQSAAYKVDTLAHRHGGQEIIHSELEFIADALGKIARGDAVPESPFKQ